MGVPGLFSFLNRRYPQITRPVEHQHGSFKRSNEQTDNLYVDMNHIVHSCTHALVAKDRPEVSQAEMFAGMGTYLDSLLDLLEPRRVVLIAVDGVAPRAKMNQQRTRRFLSAYISGITERTERDIRREMSGEAGGNLNIPDLKPFDPNIITPGTEFMLALAQWLREWAEERVSNDRRFAHTTFVISDASEPGEGEHKIMKFMRHLRTQPGYDANTRHVVFGQDADLLLLTLLSHEPHVRIIREDMQANKPEARAAREAALQQQDRHPQQQQHNPILQQQQLLLQQQPLSAVQAALMQQQQQQQQQGLVPPLPAPKPSDQTRTTASDHLNMPLFELVDIGLLRECLHWEFSDLVGRPGPPGSYGSDLGSTDSDTDIDETQHNVRNSVSNTTGRIGEVSAVQNGSDSSDNIPGNDSSSTDRKRGDETAWCGAAPPVAAAAAAAAGGGGGGGGEEYPADVAAATSSGVPARDVTVAAAAANGVPGAISSGILVHLAAPTTAGPAAADEAGPIQAEIASQGSLDGSNSLEDLLSVLNSTGSAVESESAPPPAATATDVVRSSSRNYGRNLDSHSSGSSSKAADLADSGTPCAPDPAATSALASQTTGDTTARSDANAAGAAATLVVDSTLCLPAAAAAASASAAGSDLAQGSAAGLADASGVSSSSSSNLVLQGSLHAPGAAPPSAVSATAGSRSKTVLDGMAYNPSRDNNVPSSVVPASVSVTAIAKHAKQGSITGSIATATVAVDPGSTLPVQVGVRGCTRAPRHRGKAGLSFENLLDDVVVLTFLVGNDFLPHIPSLDIYDRPTGLDLLFTAYKQLLPSLGGHLTAGGAINRSRLVQLLVYLQRDEEAAYKRRADYRRRRSCQRSAQQASAHADIHALFDGGLSMGEVPAGVDLDQMLMGVTPAAAEEQQYWSDIAAVNLWNMTPGQLCEELSNRVSARVNDRVMGGDPWAQDPIQMDMPKYRDRYYQARFPEVYQHCQGDVDKVAAKVSWEYLQGMQWVLKYYTGGPAAIRWQKQQGVDPEFYHHCQSSRALDSVGQDTRSLGAGQELSSSDASISDDSFIPNTPALPEGNKDHMNEHQQQQQKQKQRVAVTGKEQHTIVNGGCATTSRADRTKKRSSSTASSAAGLDGASWTWCYPYQYAPLMQDLSKVKLWGKSASRNAAVTAGPVHLKRQLSNPESCPISDWAPIGGPVRPLLQLMCVLPAKSAADALPAELANVIAIAETMEDGTAIAANNPQQQLKHRNNHQKHRPSRISGGVDNRQSDHNQIQSDRAPTLADEVSTHSQHSRFHELADSDSDTEADANTDCESNRYTPLHSNHTGGGNPTEPSAGVSAATDQQASDANNSSTSSGGSEQQGDAISLSHVLGFRELTGDSDRDLIRLAELLCTTFPSNIDSLVDLTGKKYIHTGVVRLPMADPQIIAAVLQAVLSMQQYGSSSRRVLSESELQGNSFRPATVVCATASTVPNSSSNGSSDGSSAVWQALARTVAAGDSATADGARERQRQQSLSGGASSSSSSRDGTAAVPPPTAAAAASRLGALGMLLGQRRALHTLPKTTLQHLPTVSSQQQQQVVTVQQQNLDVAGLPVPEHHCCLLSGVDLQDLKVTPAVWRHTAAGFATATHHAERVLGIRSSSNYITSNSVGSVSSADVSSSRGVLGRGCRGRRGRRGRSYWGEIAM